MAVWVGNFDGTPNNAFSGARAAAPIYFALSDTVNDYYRNIGRPISDNNFLTPDLNIISIDMCEIGGNIAGPYCPQKTRSYFIPGKSPITRNTVHRMIAIDNKTGLRACSMNDKNTHMEIYEFWDGEYLDMFRRAGIKRKTPPAFMPSCDLDAISNESTEPMILFPLADTKIIITSDKDFESVGIMGIATDNNSKILWFLNDTAVGSTKSGETLEYNIPIGEHTLRAVDTSGTATQINFSIVK